MTISKKYPAFILLTTMATTFAVFFIMREVLRSSLEQEILKRGEATADTFALVNAPVLERALADKSLEALHYNLTALARDADILNASVADARGVVVAALDPTLVGKPLPRYLLVDGAAAHWVDPAARAYHFRADIKRDTAPLGVFVLTLSSSPLEAPVRVASKTALIFAAGIATLMSIFGMLLARREVRPLKAMAATFDDIAKGNFALRVPEDRKDEVGELARALNYMLKRAEVFFQYNDKMIIERLIQDESLTRPGGRLRDLAVVFGDMRGYTAMSNRRNADQVVRIVNTYFHLFIECIAQWGGVVDKTMGDAIMAVFERPDGDAIDSHKRRALLATCYMKAASRILNHFLYAKRREGEELDIEAREFGFAIATGRAIVGNIGSVRRMDYTVCGRVVNLASRLEGLTKSGEVIIDNFTLKGTDDLYVYETLPAVQPKGFSEAEKVVPHRIVALAEDEMHRLRIYLKKIFTYSFIKEMLMPTHLSAGEEQAWCKEAELLILRLIAETDANDFYARVDIETGEPLDKVAQGLA